MKFADMTDTELVARIDRVTARLDKAHADIAGTYDELDRLAPAPAHIAAQRPHNRWLAEARDEAAALTARLRNLRAEYYRRGLGEESPYADDDD